MSHKATWMFFSSTGAEFKVLWRKQSVLWQILLHNVKIHKMNICSVTVPHCRGVLFDTTNFDELLGKEKGMLPIHKNARRWASISHGRPNPNQLV